MNLPHATPLSAALAGAALCILAGGLGLLVHTQPASSLNDELLFVGVGVFFLVTIILFVIDGRNIALPTWGRAGGGFRFSPDEFKKVAVRTLWWLGGVVVGNLAVVALGLALGYELGEMFA